LKDNLKEYGKTDIPFSPTIIIAVPPLGKHPVAQECGNV
jgi:hypothetical protein